MICGEKAPDDSAVPLTYIDKVLRSTFFNPVLSSIFVSYYNMNDANCCSSISVHSFL